MDAKAGFTSAHERVFKRRDHLGAFQNVARPRRTGVRFVMREHRRIDQHQTRKPHVLHGTSSATDISRMTGTDQDDTNVLQQGRRSRTR